MSLIVWLEDRILNFSVVEVAVEWLSSMSQVAAPGSEHFVVVSAKYYVEYDHTKTFLDDGYTEQYFYLVQDPKTEKWEIIDNTSPSTSNEP